MKKKILVIHPEDSTTNFLSKIYSSIQGIDLISYPGESSHIVKNYIRNADIVILLGHGTEYGLLSDSYGKRFSRYIISSKNVEELRKKDAVIGIWCNANIFFEKYNISGFSTGMFISEEKEAIEEGYGDFIEEIDQSNNLFSSILHNILPKFILEKITIHELYDELMNRYIIGPVTEFNKQGFLIS